MKNLLTREKSGEYEARALKSIEAAPEKLISRSKFTRHQRKRNIRSTCEKVRGIRRTLALDKQ